MSSTSEKNKAKDTAKRDGENAKPVKTKTEKITKDEQALLDELSKHYGVEFEGDKDKFITDCVKESHERAKQDQQEDPTEEGRFDEKLGRLRNLWTDYDGKDHPEIRKALKENGLNVGITFREDGTWNMTNGGKEDTGNSLDINTILSAAKRLTNYQE